MSYFTLSGIVTSGSILASQASFCEAGTVMFLPQVYAEMEVISMRELFTW